MRQDDSAGISLDRCSKDQLGICHRSGRASQRNLKDPKDSKDSICHVKQHDFELFYEFNSGVVSIFQKHIVSTQGAVNLGT